MTPRTWNNGNEKIADWVDAKRGDWLLTDSDNDQSVLADAVFREQYEPVSAEAVRLLAEPLEGDDEEDDA